jgi:NAD(P)-dependent dehydrogenase (short-subunit alcohol dehydrogenase family)
MVTVDESLAGQICLVTGGNRGIGAAVALALARAGADVAILARDAAAGAAVCEKVRSAGRRTMFLECDVRRPQDVEHAVAAIASEFGRLDILVTSAGIAPEETPAEDTPADQWDSVLDTNLTGTFIC